MSGRNYVFVSDLHLSEGFLKDKKCYQVNEDFFYDDAFARFLEHLEDKRKAKRPKKPWRLVINGDFLENLQITTVPEIGDLRDFLGECVKDEIFDADEARDIIANIKIYPSETKFGLGFDAPKSVWKLKRIMDGHPRFFEGIAKFLADGNEVVIIKGNHDPEFTYPEFRRYFRHRIKKLAGEIFRKQGSADKTGGSSRENKNAEAASKRVNFSPWFYYEEHLFYAEHGGQYDGANRYPFFLNPTMIYKKGQPPTIRFPLFGSAFVRYFFNEIEKRVPFADNIRPRGKAFFWILANMPGLAIIKTPRLIDFVRKFVRKYIVFPFDRLATLEQLKAEKSFPNFWFRLLLQPLNCLIFPRHRKEYFRDKAVNLEKILAMANTDGIIAEDGAALGKCKLPASKLLRIYYRAFKDDAKSEEKAAHIQPLLSKIKGILKKAGEEYGKEERGIINKAVSITRSAVKTGPVVRLLLVKWLDLIMFAVLTAAFVITLIIYGEGFSWLSFGVYAVITVIGVYVFRQLKVELLRELFDLEPESYLHKAAAGVARILSVPYVILGHTHVAYTRAIGPDGEEKPKDVKQWEVNTGSWTPVYDEKMMLRQNGDEFPFIQITTEGKGEPELKLLQWNDELGEPQTIRYTGEC
jgi:UDP-2,3-diacylglucosamine pyrophosphatase LpxH